MLFVNGPHALIIIQLGMYIFLRIIILGTLKLILLKWVNYIVWPTDTIFDNEYTCVNWNF